jgi:hypothetical protein
MHAKHRPQGEQQQQQQQQQQQHGMWSINKHNKHRGRGGKYPLEAVLFAALSRFYRLSLITSLVWSVVYSRDLHAATVNA